MRAPKVWIFKSFIYILFIYDKLFYKLRTKFCASVCIHAHAQSKRPKASKFGKKIGTREEFREVIKATFSKTDLDILKKSYD